MLVTSAEHHVLFLRQMIGKGKTLDFLKSSEHIYDMYIYI